MIKNLLKLDGSLGEWASIEERIGQAEGRLAEARAVVEDPAVATDAARLVERWATRSTPAGA